MSQEGSSPECLLITMSFNLNSISQTSVCLSVLMNLLENSFKNADSGAREQRVLKALVGGSEAQAGRL